MSVAIVVLDTLATPFIYEAEEPQQGNWSGEWGNPDIAGHVKVPEGLDPQCIMATRDDSGEIILLADPLKVQAKLDQAWTSLRTERNARLAVTDWTALSDAHLSQDRKDAWFAYRQELRDLPDLVTDEQVTSSANSVPWPVDPTQQLPVPVAGSRLSSLLDAAS
jgi:hypothetical protein